MTPLALLLMLAIHASANCSVTATFTPLTPLPGVEAGYQLTLSIAAPEPPHVAVAVNGVSLPVKMSQHGGVYMATASPIPAGANVLVEIRAGGCERRLLLTAPEPQGLPRPEPSKPATGFNDTFKAAKALSEVLNASRVRSREQGPAVRDTIKAPLAGAEAAEPKRNSESGNKGFSLPLVPLLSALILTAVILDALSARLHGRRAGQAR